MMHSAIWSNGQDMKAWTRKPPGCQLVTCPTHWTCAKHSTNATLENPVHTPSASLPSPLFPFPPFLSLKKKKKKKKQPTKTTPSPHIRFILPKHSYFPLPFSHSTSHLYSFSSRFSPLLPLS